MRGITIHVKNVNQQQLIDHTPTMNISQILYNAKGCLAFEDIDGFVAWLTRARDEMEHRDLTRFIEDIVADIEALNRWPTLTDEILDRLKEFDQTGDEERRLRVDPEYRIAFERAKKMECSHGALQQDSLQESERIDVFSNVRNAGKLVVEFVKVICLPLVALCILVSTLWWVSSYAFEAVMALAFGWSSFLRVSIGSLVVFACGSALWRRALFGGRKLCGFLSLVAFLGIIVFSLVGKPSELETRRRIGNIAKDGTYSSATWRGAASHHGGVKRWVYAKVPLGWSDHLAWHFWFTLIPARCAVGPVRFLKKNICRANYQGSTAE